MLHHPAADAVTPGADGEMLARWRLVLGKAAEAQGIVCPAGSSHQTAASLLDYLFGDQPEATSDAQRGKGGKGSKGSKGSGAQSASGHSGQSGGKLGAAGQQGQAGAVDAERQGGLGPTQWTVPEWVEKVRELFPVQAKEVLEKEFVKRRGIASLLSEPKLLERVEPTVELVKVLLAHKSLLNEHTRPVAKRLIQRVVEQIKERIRMAVEPALVGALRHDRHSPRKVFRNLDLKRTVQRNLQHYDAEKQRLQVDRLFFFAAERKKRPWHVIILVDQSGSMLESAVFSAIMASIFAELPALRTSLVLFDTNVLDISDKVGQPVDVLLSVQLGGGTHITKAMKYAEQLVREPQRTIVILISDFEEGGDTPTLLRQTELLAEAGVRLIGLAALSYEGRPEYSRRVAAGLRKAGMDILVCTPEQLAECMAKIIRG